MKVSPSAIEVIKHHEGIRLKPYRCPALLWTVGVGHVIDPSHISVKFEDRKALAIPEGWDRVLTQMKWTSCLKTIYSVLRGVFLDCALIILLSLALMRWFPLVSM